MKLQVTQENLAKALNTVARVATGRGTLPILSNVLLKTANSRLSIAATNLEIAITQYIGSKVTKEGTITVPARLMQDFVSSLPSGVIDLKLDDNKLQIKTQQYESTINGISAEDYPVMPAISKGTTWKVDAAALKTSLQQVTVAASNDEARPVLTGVYWHSFEGNLYLVATDSYRMAEKILAPTKETVSLLIPASAMQDLLRIVSEFEGEVSVIHDDQQVLFRAGDVELVTRLIEGSYPDYRKLIPSTFTTVASLSKNDFVNITKVASLFARESAGSVTIHADPEAKLLSIKSIASQLGENTSSSPATVEGEGTITLNSRYVLDALHAIPGDTVEFCFNGKLDACLLRDPGARDYVHIIMPLKS